MISGDSTVGITGAGGGLGLEVHTDPDSRWFGGAYQWVNPNAMPALR
jgi:hypothetical protein